MSPYYHRRELHHHKTITIAHGPAQSAQAVRAAATRSAWGCYQERKGPGEASALVFLTGAPLPMVLTVEKAFHRRDSLCWIRQVSVPLAPSPPPPSWPAVLARLASPGVPTGVVLPEPWETERTDNTAGRTWVCQPDQQPVSRTVLSGAPRTSLLRTAGKQPLQHERRTRFPPDRYSNSCVLFLSSLCPRHFFMCESHLSELVSSVVPALPIKLLVLLAPRGSRTRCAKWWLLLPCRMHHAP
jgi:hypothetical protein